MRPSGISLERALRLGYDSTAFTIRVISGGSLSVCSRPRSSIAAATTGSLKPTWIFASLITSSQGLAAPIRQTVKEQQQPQRHGSGHTEHRNHFRLLSKPLPFEFMIPQLRGHGKRAVITCPFPVIIRKMRQIPSMENPPFHHIRSKVFLRAIIAAVCEFLKKHSLFPGLCDTIYPNK